MHRVLGKLNFILKITADHNDDKGNGFSVNYEYFKVVQFTIPKLKMEMEVVFHEWWQGPSNNLHEP